MSYEPKPGTIAYRVIERLKALPRGREVSSGALGDDLGIPTTAVAASLESALRHGLLVSRKKGGHVRSPVFWRLADEEATRAEVAEVGERDDDKPIHRIVPARDAPPLNIVKPIWPAFREPAKDTEGLDSQHVVKAEAARPDATDRDAPATMSPVGGPMGAGQAAAAAPLPRGFGPKGEKPAAPVDYPTYPLRAALWSDGQLELRRGASFVALLDPDETRELVDYLVGTGAGEQT